MKYGETPKLCEESIILILIDISKRSMTLQQNGLFLKYCLK